jgi:hypothetical protein
LGIIAVLTPVFLSRIMMNSRSVVAHVTRNDHNACFRRKNSPMASGDDLFLVICAHGEVAVAPAKMDAPACLARNAALHAHTLPNHERT